MMMERLCKRGRGDGKRDSRMRQWIQVEDVVMHPHCCAMAIKP